MLIGWSSADITPDKPSVLRGQFHARISKFVNDPLTVTALALEGADESGARHQAIIMSCDRVNVPSIVENRVRELVSQKVQGFDPAMLFISATHTHTAAEVDESLYGPQAPEVGSPAEYCDFLVERMAQAAAEAWERRAPGQVSWAFGQAVVGHNRRVTYLDGQSKMYGHTDQADFSHIEGYEDHSVDMLFTWDPEGNLTGMLLNLACPSQVTEGEYYVSADFWHEVRVEIRRRHGEGLFILPQCSAAGDQSPHLLIHNRAEELMRQRRGLTERQEIGRRVANAVDDVLDLAKADQHSEPTFAHVTATVRLPVRTVLRGEYEAARAQREHWEAEQVDPADVFATSRRHVMISRYGKVMTRYETQADNPQYETEVHAVRLGDIAMVTNPFELFLDFGLRIKARSKAVQTFVVQLAGTGRNTMSGYLPTARAVAAKSYGAEAADNAVGPEAGQVLVDRSLELLDGLWGE
ncbi:MAG: hypothetical protein ABFE16_04235 [Armatimonadia bacterium]